MYCYSATKTTTNVYKRLQTFNNRIIGFDRCTFASSNQLKHKAMKTELKKNR